MAYSSKEVSVCVCVGGSVGKEVTTVCVCVFVCMWCDGEDYGMTGWPKGWVGKTTSLHEDKGSQWAPNSWCEIQQGEGHQTG